MSEANKELVERHFEEVWNGGDLAVADELMAGGLPGARRGALRAGRAGQGQRSGGHAPDRRVAARPVPRSHMTIEAMVAEGDTVAVRVLSEGTNLGPLNGVVPPTGKRFAARQSHWFRVADGRMAEHWATGEDLMAMLQLGLVQPPGQPPAAGSSGRP